MLANAGVVLDWFGIVIFAITGALVASRKQMDIISFVLLAIVTGTGGGTLRDLTLGVQPVFWVQKPAYIVVCAAVACVMFFVAHIPQSRIKLVLWLDAVGLALFAVTGAEMALNAGAGSIIAVTMGMVTATFGGIIRDILGGEEPIVRRPEIYVTAAMIGACLFVLCMALGVPRLPAFIISFAGGFSVRAGALYWGWTLPRYKPRPER